MKNGIVIGVLIGLAVGFVGVLVTMHFMTNEIIEKQAEAHQRGLEDGMKAVAADGVDISDHLNKGLMDENENLANRLRTVKTGLQALQGRDDLTPQAREHVSGLITGLD